MAAGKFVIISTSEYQNLRNNPHPSVVHSTSEVKSESQPVKAEHNFACQCQAKPFNRYIIRLPDLKKKLKN